MLSFKEFIVEMESNEALVSFLDKNHPLVGDEKEIILSPTVKLLKDPYGSHRFMKYDDEGTAIGVLQVVSNKKGIGHASNVYVKPEYRRHGIVRELTQHARELFKNQLTFSDDRSDNGEAYVKGVQ